MKLARRAEKGQGTDANEEKRPGRSTQHSCQSSRVVSKLSPLRHLKRNELFRRKLQFRHLPSTRRDDYLPSFLLALEVMAATGIIFK